MTAAPDFSAISGSAVVLGERAVLIRGRSGAGKSSLAAALVESAQIYGDFARLIGDDRLMVEICGDRAVISPHPAIAGRIEWRGLGILDWPHEPRAVLGLIVDLTPERAPRLPEAQDFLCSFMGLENFPRLIAPEGATGRSVAAVRQRMQKIWPN